MNYPHVFVNMASSIDGKITTRTREAFSLGSDDDRVMMETLRERADAVMIGAGTVRDEDPPLLIRDPLRRDRRIAAKGAPHPLNVVISASLDFEVEGSRFFSCSETERLVYTGAGTDRARKRQVERNAELVVVGRDATGSLELGEILADLRRRGVRELLLEGGGMLNFAMLNAGLVNEIYLTICPMVIGGKTAPTSFSGEGFIREEIHNLELISTRANERGELFLRYRVANEVTSAEAA